MNSKIFLYNEEIEKQFIQAKTLFRTSMNGIASQNMESLGYKLNYGVSLPRIKEIALEFSTNTAFAERAWQSGCREMMILATIILNKDISQSHFNKDCLIEWGKSLINIELCEQFSKNFLSRITHKNANGEDDGCLISANWSYELILREISQTKLHVALGYINLANLTIFYSQTELPNEETIYDQMIEDCQSDSFTIFSTVARFLKAKARKNPQKMNQWLDQLKKLKGNGIEYIKQEIITELEYKL